MDFFIICLFLLYPISRFRSSKKQYFWYNFYTQCDEEICYFHSLKIFIEIATQKVNSQFTHEKETENQLYAVFKKTLPFSPKKYSKLIKAKI